MINIKSNTGKRIYIHPRTVGGVVYNPTTETLSFLNLDGSPMAQAGYFHGISEDTVKHVEWLIWREHHQEDSRPEINLIDGELEYAVADEVFHTLYVESESGKSGMFDLDTVGGLTYSAEEERLSLLNRQGGFLAGGAFGKISPQLYGRIEEYVRRAIITRSKREERGL